MKISRGNNEINSRPNEARVPPCKCQICKGYIIIKKIYYNQEKGSFCQANRHGKSFLNRRCSLNNRRSRRKSKRNSVRGCRENKEEESERKLKSPPPKFVVDCTRDRCTGETSSSSSFEYRKRKTLLEHSFPSGTRCDASWNGLCRERKKG